MSKYQTSNIPATDDLSFEKQFYDQIVIDRSECFETDINGRLLTYVERSDDSTIGHLAS